MFSKKGKPTEGMRVWEQGTRKAWWRNSLNKTVYFEKTLGGNSHCTHPRSCVCQVTNQVTADLLNAQQRSSMVKDTENAQHTGKSLVITESLLLPSQKQTISSP